MPELAEVEFYRRQWNPGLDQRIRHVELSPHKRVFRGADAGQIVTRLKGATLVGSEGHGKQMLFHFSKRAWLGVHLGMTGALRCESPEFSATRHDHLVLRQARRTLVFSDSRQFGRIRFHHGSTPPAWWSALPPQVGSREFTAGRVERFLRRHARAPLKAVLLRQDAFPGIGNWMADEILWRGGFHPATQAGEAASHAHALWKTIRQVCSGALRHVAPKFADPPRSWLFQHRWKAGGRCPKDGQRLNRAEVGGRTTAWCPDCQMLR